MKNILTAVLMALSAPAFAGNINWLDITSPQTSAGSFTSMRDGSVAAGGVVGILEYNGEIRDEFVSSMLGGWTPLTLGGTAGKGLGGPSLSLGTGVNALPLARTTLLKVLNLVTEDTELVGVKSALSNSTTSDVTMFVGPNMNLVLDSIKIVDGNLRIRSHGVPTLFIGAQIKWK